MCNAKVFIPRNMPFRPYLIVIENWENTNIIVILKYRELEEIMNEYIEGVVQICHLNARTIDV